MPDERPEWVKDLIVPLTEGPERRWARLQICAPSSQGVVSLDMLGNEMPPCIHLTSTQAKELGERLIRASLAVDPDRVPAVASLLEAPP